MKKLIFSFFEVSRLAKRVITLGFDLIFVVGAFFVALFIRVEEVDYWLFPDLYLAVACTAIFSVVFWLRLGLYRAVIRFIDTKALSTILLGCTFSAFMLVACAFVLEAKIPRSIPLIYFAIVFVFVAGSRFMVRELIQSQNKKGKQPVLIYGAGSSGRQLCLALQHGAEYNPVGLVDDKKDLHGSTVNGIKVSPSEELGDLIEKFNITKVLLAIPSCSGENKAKIISKIEKLNVEMLTIPGSADLVSGKCQISELRNVAIDDLLGRESVKPNEILMKRNIWNKNVLVTGAGGSIGSELCRQVIAQKPKLLVLFEVSEYALYAIDKELENYLQSQDCETKIVPLMGSILNKDLLADTLRLFNIHTVYHAAAYKHVPLVEHNVASGIINNVWGTLNVAETAIEQSVELVVLISTDKAVRPTNFMGASKRLSELVLQAFAQQGSATCFSMVRFGNVLGSSGSVVPLFKKQIANGGPVTVTHPEITRYFMTIPEAAQLVIQAGGMANGGEVFVLDMGESVRIDDLARKMITLSGFQVNDADNPDGEIKIEYTGLRPGEKLFEELLIGGAIEGTSHKRIMKAVEVSLTMEELRKLLGQINAALTEKDIEKVRKLLIEAPLGFSPQSEPADVLWLSNRSKLPDEISSVESLH